MGLNNLIKLAVSLAVAAALSGKLPEITRTVQIAQVQLLQDSKASAWRSPDLLFRNHH